MAHVLLSVGLIVLDETEDGSERADAEASSGGDASDVAAVGEAVQTISPCTGRRCLGTITFQRVTSFPPRFPGSR